MRAALDYARATAFLFAMLYGTAGLMLAVYYGALALRRMYCIWVGCCIRCGANLEEHEILYDLKTCADCDTSEPFDVFED